ncbi:MAG TPA: NAD-dependent epimerase/dehydratase family protein [Myxococcota bacterium]|nr:NAD-dependent epimerase/dehydratase family protein [Myxococcota bacterium]HRY94597.1 NAD-dependent epimerase/dehydratase family protein [Myxococcota bacterium]HSA20321.1 NAD-dependent epimerase/dehydratase family protein [Myxococcota bacterium]
MGDAGPVLVVTGGAGFLGRAVVRALCRPRGAPVLAPREVRVLDLRPEAGLPDVPAGGPRLVPLACDVRDAAAVRRACAGADAVLHLAALIDWGVRPAALVRAVNVDGTRHVLEACLAEGVPALVHCSSEDAVHHGGPICDGDESLPYPQSYPNTYCQSKAESEQLALGAAGRALARPGPGGQTSLGVAVVRPTSIWGGGDAYHLESLLELSRRFPLPRMGDGKARFQGIYVENAAHLLLLAARALLEGRPGVSGQAFYATDYPARNFFDFFEPVLRALDRRVLPWWLAVPRPLAYGLGVLNEAVARALKPLVTLTPKISRYGVAFVCQDHTYRTDKAERLLGYAPVCTEAEAFAETIAHYRKTC